MRGNPVIQWLIFATLWLLLLIPVVRVTSGTEQPGAAARTEPPARTADQETVWVSLRFSATPSAFAVAQNDVIVWAESAPVARYFERAVTLTVEDGGVELFLAASLPEEETAIEVAVESDGRPRQTRTLWLTGDADDPVFFSWGAP